MLGCCSVALTFRPSIPDDAQAIRELCLRVLEVSADSPVFSAAHMAWKYWQPWPHWQGSRGFVLAEGERLVAHAGVVPLRFSRDGQTRRLVQLSDWAAEPRHVGAGVVLLKRIASLVDGVLNVRGSRTTQRILGPLGFRSLGETRQYAAPVDSARLRGTPTSPHAATVRARVHDRDSMSAREHPLHAAQSSGRCIVLQRSIQQIEAWLACPVTPTQYTEVISDDRLIGCFLMCQSPGQARLADVWADESMPGSLPLVIDVAYRQGCQLPDVMEVVCQTNQPAHARALQSRGFVATGADPLAVLARPEDVPSGAHIHHQLIDSDLAYLHHGEPERWLHERSAGL